MLLKTLLPSIGLYCLFFSTSIFAQQPPLQIGVQSTWIFVGEWNATYNFLSGVNAQYHFPSNNRFKPFVKAELQSDVGRPYAQLWIAQTALGIQYPLTPKKRAKWLFTAHIGGMHFRENFALTLKDSSPTIQHNGWGLTAEIGIAHTLSSNLSLQLQFQQLHIQASGLELGVVYAF